MSPLPVRTNGNAVEGNGTSSEASSRWRNDSEGGWVVQKFGGTSVGKFAVNIAEDIVRFVLSWIGEWFVTCGGGGLRGRKSNYDAWVGERR